MGVFLKKNSSYLCRDFKPLKLIQGKYIFLIDTDRSTTLSGQRSSQTTCQSASPVRVNSLITRIFVELGGVKRQTKSCR
jgi:hypothetical protein